MISEKAFAIESSRSHCPSSNNLDRLKVNPSDIPSTGSPDVIQSRGYKINEQLSVGSANRHSSCPAFHCLLSYLDY